MGSPRPVYLLCGSARMICFGDGMIVIDLIIIVYLGCWSCPWAGQPALAAQWQGSTAMSVCSTEYAVCMYGLRRTWVRGLRNKSLGA
ncbi:hypothetical protein I7I50_05340 [Histoplasma capsulatum G186AR]|uniref:Uncharacterized protein n=1 Tax=Ajellomyces capsulatus TaxID=5037 RepID=A0A8H7Z979_AJECA|nr:hypothetical protein I7I52_03601 [Histoplasma capsulatum]QSS76020.1 hypothetical protein I7I50_05340 [Histoplasma capsulatum G186AR]